MHVAVVAGPDPGHSFPAIALCQRFLAAGDTPTLLTGTEWLETARAAGVDAVELAGLDPTEDDDDRDAGAKIHQRAARMAVLNLPQLQAMVERFWNSTQHFRREFVKETFAKNFDALARIGECRSIQDLTAMQSELWRENLSRTIEGGRRAAEIYANTSQAAADRVRMQSAA